MTRRNRVPAEVREANAKAVVITLGGTLQSAANAIRSLFQVPVKITIVIRIPGLKRGDTVFGDDEDIGAVIEAIRTVTSARHDIGLEH